MPVYKATEIQFVDPGSKGKSPAFRYFIVGEESLDAEKDEAVNVEVTSDDAVNAPRYGLATYVPPPKEEEGEEDGRKCHRDTARGGEVNLSLCAQKCLIDDDGKGRFKLGQDDRGYGFVPRPEKSVHSGSSQTGERKRKCDSHKSLEFARAKNLRSFFQ